MSTEFEPTPPYPPEQPDAQYYPAYGYAAPLKHSGLGIASFVLALVFGLLLFVLILVAGVLQMQTPGGIDDETPGVIMIGLGIICGGFGNVVGLILGIVGLALSGRRKLFAALGTGLNALVILVVGALMVLGAAVE